MSNIDSECFFNNVFSVAPALRVRHEHPSCLEVDPSTIQRFETYSKDFRSACAIIRDSCFQYVDVTEEGDLAKVSKAEN